MALNFEDIKEQVTNATANAWEQFQESSLYQQGKDRFENLTPSMQKLAVISAVAFIFLIFMSFPWSFFSTASESISEFEGKRTLIRDLLKVSREANDTPDIPVPPAIDSLKSNIESTLQAQQLLPDQILAVQTISETSPLIPTHLAQGMLKISLAKLNLRQILDIGHKIQSISPSVKVKDLAIEANAKMPKYFDVTFKVVDLNVPDVAPPPEIEEPAAGTKGKKPPPKGEK